MADNPAFAGGPQEPAGDGSVDIEAALKGGTPTAEQEPGSAS